PHHLVPLATLTAKSRRVHVLKLFDPPPMTIFDPLCKIPRTSSGGLGSSDVNNCTASIGFGRAVCVGISSGEAHPFASARLIEPPLDLSRAVLVYPAESRSSRTSRARRWFGRQIGDRRACGKIASATTFFY